MKWKDLKLMYKFLIGFGTIVAILIVISILSVNGINEIITNGIEVIEGNKLKTNITERELDHVNWVNSVTDFLTDDNVNELNVEMDYHKCKFGQFYYSDSRKIAEKLVPSLIPLFKQIEDPHKDLHTSAKEIVEVFEQADRELSIKMVDIKAAHLQWMNTVNEGIMLKKNNIDVISDHNKCALGKWLLSDDLKKLLKENPEYIPLINNLKIPHEKLHSSVIQIEKYLQNNNNTAALKYYNDVTSKNVKKVYSSLEQIIQLNNNKLKNMHIANNIYVSKTVPLLKELTEIFHEMHDSVSKNIMTDYLMISHAKDTKVSVIIFSTIAAILAFIIAYFLAQNIVKPIIKSVYFAEKVANGDLTANLDINQKDEIGKLSSALNNMVKTLKDMITGIINGADNIATLSNEMNDTSQQMAQGSHEQSSSTEEISATIEELSANTQQNADNANTTKSIALKSSSEIEFGSKAVVETVNAMKIIADKIAIINDIANQTNMLALNAAVEAARAGKKGRGFAVVATEVKQLADKSHKASEEIDKVAAESVGIAENTLNIFKAIVPDIKKTANLVQEIAASSMEQNSGTEQISNAVEQLNQTTQQNAATSEEMATSAEELASQAEYLKNVVSIFNVGKI